MTRLPSFVRRRVLRSDATVRCHPERKMPVRWREALLLNTDPPPRVQRPVSTPWSVIDRRFMDGAGALPDPPRRQSLRRGTPTARPPTVKPDRFRYPTVRWRRLEGQPTFWC